MALLGSKGARAGASVPSKGRRAAALHPPPGCTRRRAAPAAGLHPLLWVTPGLFVVYFTIGGSLGRLLLAGRAVGAVPASAARVVR